MDEKLKQMMQHLGAAINDSLSESEAIAEAISEIRQAGYDVFLVLEATIGFNRRRSEEETQGGEQPAARSITGKIRLTSQDQEFLKSMKISVEE